ncbi:MAG: phosphatase PAP2 family protein, partial [Fidelibacterota bacterium]
VPPPEWLVAPDRYIPFVWWMIIPYTWHFLFTIGVLFLPDMTEYRRTILGLVWVSLLIYVVFVVWPVRVNLLDGMDFSRYPLTWMHEAVCLDYLRQNSFPAQHVVVSSIIALRMRDAFPRRAWLWLLALAMIFLSTFLIKQHYLWDSVAGLAVGLGFYRLYFNLPIWYVPDRTRTDQTLVTDTGVTQHRDRSG